MKILEKCYFKIYVESIYRCKMLPVKYKGTKQIEMEIYSKSKAVSFAQFVMASLSASESFASLCISR